MIQPLLLRVPDTKQTTDYSCGASTMQAMARYYGQEHEELDLMVQLGTEPLEGTHPQDMARVAAQLGLQGKLQTELGLEGLQKELDAGRPVLIVAQAWREESENTKPWLECWNSGHYMIVMGMDQEQVYFEDPWILGQRGLIAREEFLERWHHRHAGTVFQQAAILMSGRPDPALQPVSEPILYLP